MARSSDSVKAERINTALDVLRQYDSLAEAARALVRAYGISKRQAYRYLNEAQRQDQAVPVPEPKVAFTVKLSEGLVQRLRQRAAQTGLSLSELVTQALDVFLHRGRRSGR
jgi:predicted DNA-binding transcriptional regulator YafY